MRGDVSPPSTPPSEEADNRLQPLLRSSEFGGYPLQQLTFALLLASASTVTPVLVHLNNPSASNIDPMCYGDRRRVDYGAKAVAT